MTRGSALLTWRNLALSAAGLVIAPGWAFAQQPLPPTGPAPASWSTCTDCGQTRGPLHRLVRHTGRVLKDNLIGYPEYFVVPPLGASVNEMAGLMKARADGHEFTLYRSDFKAGSTNLSPEGAERLSRMANRLGGWLGPVMVEWTPDQPELAENRRAAVLGLLASANIPVGPERVVISPSPYHGQIGNESFLADQIRLNRYFAAPIGYSHTPIQTSTFGYGGVIR